MVDYYYRGTSAYVAPRTHFTQAIALAARDLGRLAAAAAPGLRSRQLAVVGSLALAAPCSRWSSAVTRALPAPVPPRLTGVCPTVM